MSERPRTTVSVGALHPGLQCMTRGGICVPPTVTYLPYRLSGSTLTTVGRSRLLARWPGTHSRILSGIQRAAQTVLGVYLKRTCSRVTSASSSLKIMRYTNPRITQSLTPFVGMRGRCARHLGINYFFTTGLNDIVFAIFLPSNQATWCHAP